MREDPAATYYFALLRTIVDDLTAAGRRSFAAGLKPRLQSLSNGEFAETRLGFPTFKSFLEAAEEAGVVELRRTPSDLMVVPARSTPGRQGAPPARHAGGVLGPGKRIRPDLWRAWVEWSSELKRFYDRATDRVMFFLDKEDVNQPEALVSARRQVVEEPDRYIEIEPIGAHATVDAMREFAGSWPDEDERRAMLDALTAPNPERAAVSFTRFLRVHSSISSAWHVARMQQVASAIATWCQQHGVSTNYIVDTSSGPRIPSSTAVPGRIDEDQLRSRIVNAVQRMTLADLLRLPIPAEFLLDI